MWDLRSQHPQGQLNLHSPYLCAYDGTATVLAIASLAAQSILLYDVRNYDKSPFATFDLRPAADAVATAQGLQTQGEWTKLEFSNDCKNILVATNGPGHYLIDAFEGKLEAYCARPQGPTNRIPPSELGVLRERQRSKSGGRASSQGDACLSPDGRYVIGGSGENGLFVWDVQQAAAAAAEGEGRILRPTCELSSKSAGSASVVAYNPRHNMMCTADRAVVFWLPEVDV